jgi:hypothetical protein
MINEIITAGPAWSAAAIPVRENNPAPMIAPIPRAIRPELERVLLSVPSPLCSASETYFEIDFLYHINLDE